MKGNMKKPSEIVERYMKDSLDLDKKQMRCFYYDNDRCKKGLPGTPCEIEGCVAYYPAPKTGTNKDIVALTKAEQRALEAYPPKFTSGKRYAKRIQSERVDTHAPMRTLYKRAYEQADKDLGWHSVEESLPEIDEEVIVLTNDDGFTHPCPLRICFAHLIDPEAVVNIGGKPYKIESHNGWNIPGVKYWMACPKLPRNRNERIPQNRD